VKVRWTPQAFEDRLQIWDTIAAEDPQVALRLKAGEDVNAGRFIARTLTAWYQ